MIVNIPDEKWAEQAAASVVDEVLYSKLLTSENADAAHKVVAQQLFILLVANVRPVAAEE